MKVSDFIDANPDADGCYTSPVTGERVQRWRRWTRNEKGVVFMQFFKDRDDPPVGEVLILVDKDDAVVAGCMANTFRYHAQHDGYGNFTFGPLMPPQAVRHLFEVCAKARCFQEATIRERNGKLYCAEHGLEAMQYA